MTHEYGDSFNEKTIAAAVRRALTLAEKRPSEPFELHVERAVHECVCACAVEIEDDIEEGRSGIHATLVHEVKSRAQQELVNKKHICQLTTGKPSSRYATVTTAPSGTCFGREQRR